MNLIWPQEDYIISDVQSASIKTVECVHVPHEEETVAVRSIQAAPSDIVPVCIANGQALRLASGTIDMAMWMWMHLLFTSPLAAAERMAIAIISVHSHILCNCFRHNLMLNATK